MENKDRDFLLWLSNRLIYKHGYPSDDMVVSKLIEISSSDCELNIDDSELDMIISKYYIDFFLDKTNDGNMGFTEDERQTLRKQIRCLVVDVNNKNIPMDVIK
jgi:hypothetical protein